MYCLFLSSIDVQSSIKSFWTTIANNILPIIIFASIFIEITPIKVNPISWLVELLFKPIREEMDAKNKEQDDKQAEQFSKLQKQLEDNNNETLEKMQQIKNTQVEITNQISARDEKDDVRYMKSLRFDILEFANSIDNGQVHSREEYNHIFDIINEYDEIIVARNLTNGVIEEAVKKIKKHYEDNKESSSYYF